MPAKRTETNEALNKNVRFYSKFMETPKDAQKSFNNGSFSGTDINPMWRIKILTEVFGPVGFGWWTSNVRYKFEESAATNEVHVFCELDLYVKDPETGEVSQPIYGIGGNTYIKQWGKGPKASDEAMKMAYTDAMSIACKALGIGHDIWYSNDRTKYTMTENNPTEAPAAKATAAKPAANEAAPKAEAPAAEQPAHTEDTAKLIDEIDAKLKEIKPTLGGSDGIKKFAYETIQPIIGNVNFRSCTDITKLTALRDKLCA